MQISNTLGKEHIYIELVFPIRLVNAHRAQGNEGISVFGSEAEALVPSPKHHCFDPAVGILQGEIHVPGTVMQEVGYFTLYSHTLQRRLGQGRFNLVR